MSAIAFAKQDGRYPFTPTLKPSGRGLEFVPQKKHDRTCRESPRSGECTSRLGIPTQDGLQRLEALPGDIPAVGRQVGPLLNGHGCFQNECPAAGDRTQQP